MTVDRAVFIFAGLVVLGLLAVGVGVGFGPAGRGGNINDV